MQYTVQLFAGLAERLGTKQVEVHSAGPVNPMGLKTILKDMFPNASHEIERALVAVNLSYAHQQSLLSEEHEIALIPPVGGGSEDSLASCAIHAGPLQVEQAYLMLQNTHKGGTVLFTGTVREWTSGRQTHHLTYEAYAEMALAQMRLIEADVLAAHPDAATLMWHRIGHLEPSDIAVICGASAPHRDTAFAAARTLIERLKAEVPIWKKEYYTDGENLWREN